ncbi:hypothetical protein V8C86DRAFT_2645415, partial [Haematococcus lacustris]
WIMQGILDFLTSAAPEAALLRSSFVFKIIPMLNTDGVINGSYRCSLAGCDLNRTWERPVRWLQPTVFHTKRLMQALAASPASRLALYIDIHGHSTKEDVFFYGCEPSLAGLPTQPAAQQRSNSPAAPRPTPGRRGSHSDLTDGIAGLSVSGQAAVLSSPSPGNGHQCNGAGSSPSGGACPAAGVSPRVAARLRVRMLPYLLARRSPQVFSLAKSNFRVRKPKLGAARVVAHRELGCAGAYTLEASLGGRSADRCHFSAVDYVNAGAELCRAIAELAEVDDAGLLEEMAGCVALPPYTSAYTS